MAAEAAPKPHRLVVDLGNTRLKWAAVAPDGTRGPAVAVAVDDEPAWAASLAHAPGSAAAHWTIASVRPPAAEALARWLTTQRPDASVRWFRSAADVPVAHRLARPAATGVDRALGVCQALHEQGGRGPGLVVSCGTAITVDRVGADGGWQGGAIAPGWRVLALALNQATAQLPVANLEDADQATIPALGDETRSALRAGLYWGQVGAVRELITRQRADLDGPSWIVWTGGDASWLARAVLGPGATIRPDLVLDALARLGFAAPSERP